MYSSIRNANKMEKIKREQVITKRLKTNKLNKRKRTDQFLTLDCKIGYTERCPSIINSSEINK